MYCGRKVVACHMCKHVSNMTNTKEDNKQTIPNAKFVLNVNFIVNTLHLAPEK